jgi:hypothetical protein
LWFLHFRRLVLIFLSLSPNGLYSKGTILYLHLINHWRTHNLDIFQHLQSSIFSFDEEYGEASLAVLARSVITDADQSTFSKLQASYQAQPFISASTSHQQPSASQCHPSNSDYGPELLLVENFLSNLISQIGDSSLWPYSATILKKKSFLASEAEHTLDLPLEPNIFLPFVPTNFTTQAEAVTAKLSALLLYKANVRKRKRAK